MSRRIQDIDMGTLMFDKQKQKSNNKFLYVFSDKKPLVIKLPLMRLPFGLQKDSFNKKNQYILDLSMESSPDILECFGNLDEAIIKKVNKEFFTDISLEETKNRYTSCIKIPSNMSFSPTLRCKIIVGDNYIPKCDFYESEKDDKGKYPKIDIQANGGDPYMLAIANKGSKVESIVECIGLWFFKDRFGLSFKVNQLLIHPNIPVEQVVSKPVSDCQFIDSESDTSNSDVEFLWE